MPNSLRREIKRMINSDLYEFAHNNAIVVLPFSSNEFESLSMQDNEYNCYIGMDYKRFETSKEERVHLAHELGHCATGAFYNARSPLYVRGKAEYQADKWAIKKIIPKDDFMRLLKCGMPAYELAEQFNVTEDYIHKAFRLYIEMEII